MAKSIKWKGGSGKTYEYWIHPIGADFKDEPGNYIYAAETQPHCWQAVYHWTDLQPLRASGRSRKGGVRYTKQCNPHPCTHDFWW